MEAKLKTPTCSRCKTRKIRCDGLDPCYSCSTAAATCYYDGHAKESRFGFELRKGQACLACRRKKKRCDGQQPCRTCASGRKKIPCEYPDGIVVTLPLQKSDGNIVHIDTQSSDSGSPAPSPPSGITPSAFSNHSSETSASSSSTESPVNLFTPPNNVDVYEIQSPSMFTLPELAASSPVNYMTLAELSQARDMFLDNTGKRDLNADIAPNNTEDTNMASSTDTYHVEAQSPPHTYSPFFQIEIPRQDPKDEAEELAGIRRLFLNHRTQLGLSVPDPMLEAIAYGITSDTLLHPALLHACQLMGYMLANLLPNQAWLCLPGRTEREAEQLCLANRGMDGPPTTRPVAVAHLQTLTLLSLYSAIKGDIARARELLLAGNALIRTRNLDALPPPPSTDSSQTSFKIVPTTPEAEMQAAVSQLVYLDLSYAVILKIPSLLDPVLRDNFRTLISRPNENADTNYIRAKSAYLLHATQELTAKWYHQPGLTEAETMQWQRYYWDVMEALDTHRSFVALTLTKAAFCPTLRTMSLSLKICAVMVQTGLAALLSLFSADHAELRQKKHAAIAEIISISSVFSDEDCEHLDPVLSACWSAVIRTLDMCIALGPDHVQSSMHDIPAMAGMIRARNKTMQRLIPFAVDI
ncbi:hypothetical protein B0H19DRAFT_1192909 [Mycena capillaripes]|nr:hypothetical protein B0H19DRAFT_1192909 [Mycena capillaripes]